MNNLPNKQTNPVLAGCLTLSVLAIMIGSVHALRANETAIKTSNIVVSHKASQTTAVIETQGTSQLPSTTVTPTPIVVPVSAAAVPVITSPGPTPAPTPAPPSYVYTDGNYSAIGTFTAPGVTNHLNVSLTISKDVITDSTVTIPNGTDPTSKNYDNNFIANYKPYVTGKPLANLNLSKVSSASLTPNGFNNALTQIRSSAHS
jgi:hypothetical protein